MYPQLWMALGIFSVSLLPSLPNQNLLFLSVVLVLFAWRLRCYWLLLLMFGALYSGFYAHYLVAKQLPIALDNTEIYVVGQVVGLPEQRNNKQRFQLKIHTFPVINSDQNHQQLVQSMLGQTLLISWYLQDKQRSNIVASGEYWQFKVKWRRPRGFVNPAGFDYQRYLLQKGISATAYVKNDSQNRRVQALTKGVCLDCWRSVVVENIQDLLQGARVRNHDGVMALLLALAAGDKRLITQEQWQRLRDTGTIHLMAISGLHIGLAALIGLFLGKLCIRLLQFFFPFSLFTFIPVVFSLCFSFSYALLAGMSLPTQRALIMIVIVQIFYLSGKRVSPWFILTTALCAVAIFDPLAVYQAGFYLSFLAVVVLVFTFSGYSSIRAGFWSRCWSYFLSLSKAQCILALGLLVPSLFFMQGLSLLAPVANIIAVPLVSFFVVPLILGGLCCLFISPSIAAGLFAIANELLSYLWQSLSYLDNLSQGYSFWWFDRGALSWYALVLATLGVIFLLMPLGLFKRYLALFCFLPLFFSAKKDRLLEFDFLDVGQGTAVVIKTKNHVLVYDTGKKYSDRFSAGAHIIAPSLMQDGFSTIDALMLSHADSDHAGGAEGLLAKVTVDTIWSGQPNEHRFASQQCQAGQTWQWDKVTFSVLWPTRAFLQSGADNSNNYSCVLLVQFGEYAVLLPGDIEASIERELLMQLPAGIDILLAPHHGSRTSSHQQWIEKLAARHVVFMASYHSQYGHPHRQVVERYQRSGAAIYHTGKMGALRFSLNDYAWSVKEWRRDFAYYWYW